MQCREMPSSFPGDGVQSVAVSERDAADWYLQDDALLENSKVVAGGPWSQVNSSALGYYLRVTSQNCPLSAFRRGISSKVPNFRNPFENNKLLPN